MLIPKYQKGQELRISSTPNYDEWIPTGGGGHIPFDLLSDTPFIVDEIFVRVKDRTAMETEESDPLLYLIKEKMTRERRKSLVEHKNRIASLDPNEGVLKGSDSFYKSWFRAKNLDDKQWMKSRIFITCLPERCLSPFRN